MQCYFYVLYLLHGIPPPPWCISILYVVVNQYSYLLNSSKFKMIMSRFKLDMATCNISKLPCKKYIIFLRLDMQRNYVDMQEKLIRYGFKKIRNYINNCRHVTFITCQMQLTRIFTSTCKLLMLTCTCMWLARYIWWHTAYLSIYTDM